MSHLPLEGQCAHALGENARTKSSLLSPSPGDSSPGLARTSLRSFLGLISELTVGRRFSCDPDMIAVPIGPPLPNFAGLF
jgi:hypothetical protein